jgi:redox-sensitive bicupin YhaK (pirin superfamily)
MAKKAHLLLIIGISLISSSALMTPGGGSRTNGLRRTSSHEHTPLVFATPISTSTDEGTSQYSSDFHLPTQRQIANVEKFARLPVWPVWQGVFLFFLSKIAGQEVAAKLEDVIGGRVCPNFFSSGDTSPFVLLVHHRHSFSSWDPIRYIQRTFFPEGFPAHPHRGFVTVTYCLKGGMIHRDSLGIKQAYGAEDRHEGKHVQWLTAGAGIQHEEMWDVEPDSRGGWTSSQELYQIWLNLPAAYKMSAPNAELLEAKIVDKSAPIPEGITPIIVSDEGNTITTVVSGEHNGIHAPVDCPTDASILRIEFTSKNQSIWKHMMPRSHKTAILYVKKGAIKIGDERVPPHHTVYLTPDGEELTIEALEGEADVLLLTGAPLCEPIVSQGSMVMNTNQEIQEAYIDFQRGYMGVPWREKLSDYEWREHVKKNPSRY